MESVSTPVNTPSEESGIPASEHEASASSTSSTAPRAKVARNKITRSCLMCHERKIRCDRRLPCSNCARVDLLCCYPEAKRNETRPQKMSITEMASRVARLERTIATLSSVASTASNGDAVSEHSSSWRMSAANEVEVAADPPCEELLLHDDDGNSSRYVNEALFSRLLDGVRSSLENV